MNAIEAAVAKAVEAVLAKQALAAQPKPKAKKAKAKGKGGRKPLTDAEKAVFMARNDADCIAAFAARGFKVVPRETALTFRKWTERGRVVKKGERSVQVGPFRLFAFEQTEPAPEVVGA